MPRTRLFLVDADARTWQAVGREPEPLPDGLDITLTTARSELTVKANVQFFFALK